MPKNLCFSPLSAVNILMNYGFVDQLMHHISEEWASIICNLMYFCIAHGSVATDEWSLIIIRSNLTFSLFLYTPDTSKYKTMGFKKSERRYERVSMLCENVSLLITNT